ncbi:response regulator transcription factor [Dehalococcoidia bacterium]|nr:response regulator transcription factor [Dehalococcoidia bacterium]
MSHHILVADDDSQICEALERSLRYEGYKVVTVRDGSLAISEIEKNPPSLLVLDINMPEVNGIQVTRYVRSVGIDIPICILSARDEVKDRVAGLEAGADDYMTKPFAFEELLARIKALLRRNNIISSQTISIGNLELDPSTRTVKYFGQNMELTKKEFDLLQVLCINANVVQNRDQLLDKVWGYDFEVNTNVVDVFIGYLRKKMESNGNPRMINTIRGVGFMLSE